MSDLASTQPATRPLGTGQRTWRCGGFLRWRPGARLVMMQGQKSRTTEAYLRILYWTWGHRDHGTERDIRAVRRLLARTLCRASTGIRAVYMFVCICCCSRCWCFVALGWLTVLRRDAGIDVSALVATLVQMSRDASACSASGRPCVRGKRIWGKGLLSTLVERKSARVRPASSHGKSIDCLCSQAACRSAQCGGRSAGEEAVGGLLRMHGVVCHLTTRFHRISP